MKNLTITPLSLIRRDGLRRVDVTAVTERAAHYELSVFSGETLICKSDLALPSGKRKATLWLELPREDFESRWEIRDRSGELVTKVEFLCKKPREWTFYVMVSSHTDIGLHNSQYIQRQTCTTFIKKAMELCDVTDSRPEESRYRYTLEGSWVLSNFLADNSPEDSRRLLDYINSGKIGVCAGVAGNHTQVYGFEELCRSAYSRKWLAERGVETKTLTMIDNNGISPSIIQPYADAGFENIIFAPNHWNPLMSTVWHCDRSIPGYPWYSHAGGGGSRCDVCYDSEIPMLFWWESEYGKRLLVWSSTQYDHGGKYFGLAPYGNPLETTEEEMAAHLPELEARYPYDLWLLANYGDDQSPSLGFVDSVTKWNERYEFPKLRLLGNPDEPFRLVRERFGDEIPTLRGDITGGWYQHPLSAADLLADKLNADRALANAEKFASIAALKSDYLYPESRFNRAWAALIMNDEHSYGTSGYQGRRVYETWIGHRDWIEKAAKTASEESESALKALGKAIEGDGERVLVFNPSAFARTERLIDNGECIAELPPFGWTTVSVDRFVASEPTITEFDAPPTIENDFYRVRFAENGSLAEIYDKSLGRVLNSGNCNEMLYTRDNHVSFSTPERARFRVIRGLNETRVEIRTREASSGADIFTEVILPKFEKRIDIDNRLTHIRDMVNSDRYKRYLYFGFPFDVKKARRVCELGGVEAEYAVDVTGHGTDVYMAAHEYCAIDSSEGWGVGFIQLDSQLVEFDYIHPDKTDFANAGEGSALYSYVANDWLQMHLPGGNSFNLRLRYTITSYEGDHVSAKLERLAERLANPPLTLRLNGKSDGNLPSEMSLIESSARLVGLSRAHNGVLTARFYSRTTPEVRTDFALEGNLKAGFSTLTLACETLATRPERVREPLEIGGVETGLVTEPRAARGENDGMLYLLWGKCASEELAYYELYRGEREDFEADDSSFVARVEPEEYVVGRFIDEGLEVDKRYYYRVRAVDKRGNKGELSRVFSALTKESSVGVVQNPDHSS